MREPITVDDELYVLPEQLEIASTVEVTTRKRGIYACPSTRRGSRQWPFRAHRDARRTTTISRFSGTRPQIALPITDARSIGSRSSCTIDGARATFQPGGTRVAGFGPQLVAPYAELGPGALGTAGFFLDVVLDGTGTLRFLPLGADTPRS